MPDSRLILYDGYCALCNWWVRAILRIDRKGVIQFAPIAGVTGQSILSLNPELKGIDSIILVAEIDAKREFSTKSQAIVRVLGLMPFPIRLLQLVGLLPRKLLDLLYDAIARNRARLFGTYDHCPLPAPDVRNRFLP